MDPFVGVNGDDILVDQAVGRARWPVVDASVVFDSVVFLADKIQSVVSPDPGMAVGEG